jgi:hypothetical protein
LHLPNCSLRVIWIAPSLVEDEGQSHGAQHYCIGPRRLVAATVAGTVKASVMIAFDDMLDEMCVDLNDAHRRQRRVFPFRELLFDL